MKALCAFILAMAGGAAAGQTLIVHYSERAGVHYTTQQGQLAASPANWPCCVV